MYPVLLKIGKFSIHTYGFFVALGFLTAILFAKHEAKRKGMDYEKIMDLCFYILLAAIVGSRLLYIAINLDMFLSDPLEIFKIWNGGLVFYGGFIAALITLIVYLKKQKMPLWKTADIMAPALALGHCIGRIGCFFAGCCYGKPCDLPWAVTFTNPATLAPVGISLHPTQLYSSASNLIIFGMLLLFRRYQKFEGQLLLVYIFLYGIFRSIIEAFRGDFRGNIFGEMFSLSQVIGCTTAIAALVVIVIINRRARA